MKAVIIGLGYMGQNHTRILSGLEDVDLVAVCDMDESKAKSQAKKFKVNYYTDYKELLLKEKPQAVFICLPTSLHFEAVMFALKLKIPTFVEKPIAATILQAKKLESFSKLNKVPLMIGHIERFNPVITEIKNRINTKELGKILHIHTQRFSPPPTRAQDVSAIVDLATHDIDIISFIAGELPIRIFAETDTKYHSKEDLMSALLRFKSGIIGLIEVSWLHPTKIRNITVLGENGMYSADYLTQELFFYKQNEVVAKRTTIPSPAQTWADVVKVAFEAKEPLLIEIRSFINALKSKSKMPVTPKEGLSALIIIDKMSKSGFNNKVLK